MFLSIVNQLIIKKGEVLLFIEKLNVSSLIKYSYFIFFLVYYLHEIRLIIMNSMKEYK